MIELRDIKKTYKMASSEVHALNGVSLKIEKGDFLALKGPSGSGKSTLLNIIGLVDVPSSGEYLLDGEPVHLHGAKQRSASRRKYLGFIFQNFNLIPELSIYENVEIPLLINRVKAVERRKLIETMVEEVGLASHIRHKPGELSGGQQQRVAIARALVQRPPLVIADEPTANLDSRTGKEIVQLMRDLNDRHKITFVFATHDELILDKMKSIVYISDGQISGMKS